jgi:hypothetical protein
MASQDPKKVALQKTGKLAGYPQKSKKHLALALTSTGQKAITKLQPQELKQLLGKGSFPVYLDFSSATFQLEDDQVFASCPNVVKEYDFSRRLNLSSEPTYPTILCPKFPT